MKYLKTIPKNILLILIIAVFGLAACSDGGSPTDAKPDKPGIDKPDNGSKLKTWLTATIVWPDGSESEFAVSYNSKETLLSGKNSVGYADAETSGLSQVSLEFEAGGQHIELTVNDDNGIEKGDFPVLEDSYGNGGSIFSFSDLSEDVHYVSHHFDLSTDGKITISKVDDKQVKGTFSATLVNKDNHDEVIEIKDGGFHGYFNQLYFF